MENENLPRKTIRIVAPAGPVTEEDLDAGISVLAGMGFNVSEGRHVRKRDRYLAGPDESRIEDLQEALDDPVIDIVWFARGGYGVTRILDRLSLDGLESHPKIIAGFSDATALHCWASSSNRSRLLYAPAVQELGREGVCHKDSLWNALKGEYLSIPAKGGPSGSAGPFPVIGGCLTLLSVLVGTRWSPEVKGRWLFMEEVGEKLYRVDRMMTHLSSAGWFSECSGILLGGFTGMPEGEGPEDVLARVRELIPSGKPVVWGLPVGHLRGKYVLPFEVPASWDGKSLIFEK